MKRKILHIIEWAIALAACGYLVWRLATYDDYASLLDGLRAMNTAQWCALIASVLLMPVNMTIEAWRWRTLMNEGESRVKSQESIGWAEAHRQVYYSKLAGLITPWRLGEYPARGLLMQKTLFLRKQNKSHLKLCGPKC